LPIHNASSGNAVAAAGLFARASAVSRKAIAAFPTAADPLSGGISSDGMPSVTMAAESYMMAIQPRETPATNIPNDRARMSRAADPVFRLALFSSSSAFRALMMSRASFANAVNSLKIDGAPMTLLIGSRGMAARVPKLKLLSEE